LTLRQTILGIVLLTATSLAAPPTSLHLCVVQPSEGLSSSPGNQSGWGGSDAKMLAKELSIRKLPDGTPIQAIAIVRKNRKDAQDEAQRQDCSFIVEIWDHHIGGMAYINPDPVPGSPTAGIPGGVPAHPEIIDNGIEWAMTRSDSRKVIGRGYLPIQGHYKGQTNNRTFPALATQITDKLNRIDKR
jgi:hypothetical protein